jgi:hypothetical protein
MLLAALLLIGVSLLVRGIRGRRVGYEPRCGRCGYDLTMLGSERCPECGNELAAGAIVYGVRRRRRVALTLGLVLCVGASSSLVMVSYLIVQRSNLYQVYPFFKLLSDARGGDAKSLVELERRLRTGSLSSRQMRKLADTCLVVYQPTTTLANTQRWIDLLDVLDRRGALDESRQKRYYEGVMSFALEVRPEIGEHACLPVRVSHHTRGPSDGSLQWKTDWEQIRVGDWKRHYGGNSAGLLGLGHMTSMTCLSAGDLAPGPHVVELDVKYEIHRGSTVLLSATKTVTAETTVRPDDQVTRLVALRDADLGRQIEGMLVVEDARLERGGSRTRFDQGKPSGVEEFWQLEFVLRPAAPLPVNVAFDVIVKFGDQQREASGFTVAKGAQPGVHLHVEAEPDLREFTIILRSREEKARATVDMTDYWEGEITLGPVPAATDDSQNHVDPPPAPAPSGSATP